MQLSFVITVLSNLMILDIICLCRSQRLCRVLGMGGRTLGKLENVLLPVDNLERARGRQLADVARVEPAVLAQHLTRSSCELGI